MFPQMRRELLSAVTGLDFKSVILLLVLVLGVILGAVLRQPEILKARLETAAVEARFAAYKLDQEAKFREAVAERQQAFREMNVRIGELNEEFKQREAKYRDDNAGLRNSLARERVLRQKLETAVSSVAAGAPAGAGHETPPGGVVLSPDAERIVRIMEDADSVLLQAQECQAYVEAVHLIYGE